MVHVITMLTSIAHIYIGEYKNTLNTLEKKKKLYPVLTQFFYPKNKREIQKKWPQILKMPDNT